MRTIHWLGAGLSSIPGIRRLAAKNFKLIVWNRTLSKAEKSIDHVKSEQVKAQKYDFIDLEKQIKENDIVVSQLSANMHLEIAKLCILKKSHFVTTSYTSPEIKKLNSEAKKNNLVILNEVGLDPGIDHFFTHLLVNDLKEKNYQDLSVSYHSYCGGIPALANDFKYKFSWSPVGVIKALNSEAKFIENFVENSKTPYKYIKNYSINNETFEAYPNRDSLPYIDQYMFPKSWKIEEFIRGTLRLEGWGRAWSEIFEILNKKDSDLDEKIVKKSDELWNSYQYKKNEEDRVVLWVKLEAKQENRVMWSKYYHIDEKGTGENTAMAKLVSITLSGAIELMIQNKIPTGIQSSISDKNNIDYLFNILFENSIKIIHQ